MRKGANGPPHAPFPFRMVHGLNSPPFLCDLCAFALNPRFRFPAFPLSAFSQPLPNAPRPVPRASLAAHRPVSPSHSSWFKFPAFSLRSLRLCVKSPFPLSRFPLFPSSQRQRRAPYQPGAAPQELRQKNPRQGQRPAPCPRSRLPHAVKI